MLRLSVALGLCCLATADPKSLMTGHAKSADILKASTAPLQSLVAQLTPAVDEGPALNSLPAISPPVANPQVVFSLPSMPPPDKSAKMETRTPEMQRQRFEGWKSPASGTLTFRSPLVQPESEADDLTFYENKDTYLVNKLNMHMPIALKGESKIAGTKPSRGAVGEIYQDAVSVMENDDASSMPRSTEDLQVEDCADEEDVASVGVKPAFSANAAFPKTQEYFAVPPEVNSYKDFVAGTPKPITSGTPEPLAWRIPEDSKVVPATMEKLPGVKQREVFEVQNNRIVPPDADEIFMMLPLKFSAKLEFFQCKHNMPMLFDAPAKQKILREALGLGAGATDTRVRITDVDNEKQLVGFDLGAPDLQSLMSQLSLLKDHIRDKALSLSLESYGFPLCDAVLIVAGDPNAEMPEASVQSQLGPPGGMDDQPLTMNEQRERQRARDLMRLEDEVTPGRVDMTKLLPDLFKENKETQDTKSKLTDYKVVGRIKFALAQPGIADKYKNVVSRVFTDLLGVETERMVMAATAEQGKVLDFEVLASSEKAARTYTKKLIDAIMVSGKFRQLMQRSGLLQDNEFALLFVEVHTPVGAKIDEDGLRGDGPLRYVADGYGMEVSQGLGEADEECDDEDDVVTPTQVVGGQGAFKGVDTNMNTADVEDCTDNMNKDSTAKSFTATPDHFAEPTVAKMNEDGWSVMATVPKKAAPMQAISSAIPFRPADTGEMSVSESIMHKIKSGGVPMDVGAEWAPPAMPHTSIEGETGVPMRAAARANHHHQALAQQNDATTNTAETTTTTTTTTSASALSKVPTSSHLDTVHTKLTPKIAPATNGIAHGLFQMLRSHVLLEVEEGKGTPDDLNQLTADDEEEHEDAALASPAHDELLVQVAAQVDAPRIEHNAMRDSYLRQVQEDAALIQSGASAGPAHADMGGMDEPDNSAEVPAGGFPVPDYD